MKLVETGIKDLYVIEPKIFGDHRGYFLESYNKSQFDDLGLTYSFVQDNESFSKFGTLRGLHFQKGEFAQAKFVRVTSGRVLDVVVDLRKDSETFGKSYSVELSDENKKMFMIPRGFAHGFVVLSETAIFSYKCDNKYVPGSEGGLAYNDPDLKIDWIIPCDQMILSEKDKLNPTLKELKTKI
jgi:dTDP-4-dehydrorhamnose 3,5-epimerase